MHKAYARYFKSISHTINFVNLQLQSAKNGCMVHDTDSVAAAIQSSELLNHIAGTCICEYHAKFDLNSGKYIPRSHRCSTCWPQ